MKFTATISSRSSNRASGPPGEAEVLRLNLQRRELILQLTGWPNLFEGTLNLEVDPDVVAELKSRHPLIREPGDAVVYPKRYQHIPRKRVAYLYYRGTLHFGSKSEDVLIRTAENPLKSRLEAFATVKLRDSLGLSDGDQVVCRIVD